MLIRQKDDLVAILAELAEIYERVCTGSGEVPSTILLDRVEASLKGASFSDPESPEAIAYQRKSGTGIKFLPDVNKHGNVSANNLLVDTIRDQLRHLKEVVDVITVEDKQHGSQPGKLDSTPFVEKHQVGKALPLESLLTIKNEQIATLRDVLKANKQIAEKTITNLKEKHEKEKAIVRKTMMKLRFELNFLKECKETFATLRSLLGVTCDQFITQLNELQGEMVASEEEITQLNSLLNRTESPETTSLTNTTEGVLDGFK